jgi:8-oxo-dGTP pyrophosphatase MutT (NUDIX family)
LNWGELEANLNTRTRRALNIAEFKRAAVLVPVLLEPEPTLILTQRTSHLPTHKGQIAFPGGKLEPEEDAVIGALREAHEEIRLEPSAVRVLGMLHDVWTPQGFQVTPVLGIVSSQAVIEPDPSEVARVLLVPIAQLLELAPREDIRLEPPVGRWPEGVTGPRAILHYDWNNAGETIDIWGMTAFVIHELLELLRRRESVRAQ